MKRERKYIILFLFLIIIHSKLYSAFDFYSKNARIVGMGDSFTAVANDASTVFINPAGLGIIKKTQIIFDYAMIYQQLGIKEMDISAAIPLSCWGGGGIHISSLNYGLYSESSFFIGYAKEFFNIVSIGASMSYMGWKADQAKDWYNVEKLSKNFFSYNVGVLGFINGFITVGFSVHNFNQPRISYNDDVEEYLLPVYRSGISFIFKDGLFSVDMVNTHSSVDFLCGFEKLIDMPFINKLLTFRSGVEFIDGSEAIKLNLGFGTDRVISSLFKVDYGVEIPLFSRLSFDINHYLSVTIPSYNIFLKKKSKNRKFTLNFVNIKKFKIPQTKSRGLIASKIEGNIIINPSFENDEDKDNFPDSWLNQTGDVLYITNEGYSGNRCVEIKNEDPKHMVVLTYNLSQGLDSNKTYILSFYGKALEKNSKISFYVQGWKSGKAVYSEGKYMSISIIKDHWSLYRAIIKVPKNLEDLDGIYLHFVMGGPGRGKGDVLVDDVIFQPLKPKPWIR